MDDRLSASELDSDSVTQCHRGMSPSEVLVNWAPRGPDSRRRGAPRERAVVVDLQPPPVDAVDSPGLQHGVGDDPHEGDAGVEPRREHVVVARPPGLVPPVHDMVEGEPHGAPHEVVDGPRRRHHPRGAQQHGHVDEPQPRRPRTPRERPRQRPERHRGQRAGEEEVVHLGVEAQPAEHAQRPHHAPDDGRVEEDVVARARPWAPFWKLRRVADVGHALQQPPRRAEVYRRRQDRTHQLRVRSKCFEFVHEFHRGEMEFGLNWSDC